MNIKTLQSGSNSSIDLLKTTKLNKYLQNNNKKIPLSKLNIYYDFIFLKFIIIINSRYEIGNNRFNYRF